MGVIAIVDAQWAAGAVVLGALIAGPTMWLLHRFDARNTEQHNGNFKVLNDIRTGVERIETRLDTHLEWHAETPKPDLKPVPRKRKLEAS
jgi:hypothetical protein